MPSTMPDSRLAPDDARPCLFARLPRCLFEMPVLRARLFAEDLLIAGHGLPHADISSRR